MDSLLTRSRAQQLDDALSTGSAQEPAVRDGLALAARLRAAGEATAPVPTPEFREALRTRLMAVAAVQGVGATAAAPPPRGSAVSWRQRAVAVGAGVMATAVAASGVAVASSQSLPGDPFYGVKRTAEGLQLRVADGAQEEGTRHLQFAATRLREVRALVLGRDAAAGTVAERTVPAEVETRVLDALADMDDDTRTGARLLTSSFRASRSTAPLEELSRFATAQGDGLRDILPALSGPGRLQAQQSLALVQSVQSEAAELLLLVDCTTSCDPAQVAPVGPAPGAEAPPCGCPTPVPTPQTAPAPPPPSDQPDPAGPAPGGSSPGPPAAPSNPPPAPAPQPEPQPEPLPGVPLPSPPALPTLPPVEPLEPVEPGLTDPLLDPLSPSVQVPSLSGDGLLGIGAAPSLITGSGPLAVAVRALAAWLR